MANEARNRRRSAGRRAALSLRASAEESSGGAAPSPEVVVLAGEDRERLLVAVNGLREEERLVIACRFFLELSEEETAAALDCSLSAANSTLHRARVTLEARVGPRSGRPAESHAAVDRALLERYLRAWESADLDTIVAILHEDVILSMPPIPRWLSGLADVGEFFRAHVRGSFRAHVVEANGAPAAAFYRVKEDRQAHLFAIQLYELDAGRIRVIDHFMTKRSLFSFVAEGLSTTIAV